MYWEFKYGETVLLCISEEEASAMSSTLIAQKVDFEVEVFEPFHCVWVANGSATFFKEEDDAIELMRKLVRDKTPFKYSIHRE